MQSIFKNVKGQFAKSINRERAFDPFIGRLSRILWPWKESRLLILAYFLAMLDYTSTYAVLELSGNKYVQEGGQFASWALQKGGFAGLFLFDVVALTILLIIAVGIRFLYSKINFNGFGRAGFVIVLVPYVVITIAVVFNNVFLTFSH
jgi:hypothetical protein